MNRAVGKRGAGTAGRMAALKLLVLLWICDRALPQGSEPTKNGSLTSPPMTGRSPLATPTGQRWGTGLPTTAPPAEDKSALTVAALGVIIFIAILLAVVIVLVSVVSLRFRCRRCKEAEDKQKPQHPVISFSYSDADTAANRKSVLLLSMKELSDSNSIVKAKVADEE